MSNIKKRLNDNPDLNFLVLFIVAGHGMIFYGYQSLILNEFDKYTNFYKQWGLERDCRDLAKKFRNSYVMAVFACCRELF